MACVTKRRDRWILDYYDQHGKRRWKTLPKGSTKKEAKEILKGIEDKVNKGVFIPNKKIPTFAEVADMWLEVKKQNIRASTHEQYRGHIENHLKPFFTGIWITRIGYDQVEQFLSHCYDEEMNIATTKKILVNLGAIMTYAVRKRLIDYNPVRDIEKPKGQTNHDEEKDLKILEPSELIRLFDNAPDSKHKTIFMVAGTTGLRQGEILGLKWTDIDWINGQVHVNRTYNHFAFYDPKSQASKRKVDVPPQTLKQLKKWRLACIKSDLDLIFPNENGKPLSALNMFNRKFIPTLKKARLKKIRFHDLRHTYASIQIDLEANPKYIQSQMGHSSIRITLDTYGHLMKEVNQEAAVKLGKAIFEHDGSKMVAEKEKGVMP